MKQYQKGIFVFDFLQELGLSMLIIGKALEDNRLNKSYRVIKSNPKITQEEFLTKMQLVDSKN